MKNLLARLLIFFGILCILYGSYLTWERNNPNQVTFNAIPVSHTSSRALHQPVQIVIASVGINLPLYKAHVTNGIWETTTDGASYLASSPIPGETGNSIIYAHNWYRLFGKLVRVVPGEKIQVIYDDTSKKIFTIAYTSVVTPNDIGIISPSKDRRITLYTCTNFLDSKRFVAVAILDQQKPQTKEISKNN